MMKNIKFWLECSRYYALPMTFFSWLVVFVFGLQKGGNFLYGVIALIGIASAHLATNLFDDFCDFHRLKKNIDKDGRISIPNTQRGKCSYLINGLVSEKEVITTVLIYCIIALLVGILLYFLAGHKVVLFMTIGAVIVLSYSFLSNIRLSELAVATAFGPLLFCGTYYVMTGSVSLESFIISVPVTFFTVNLLYTDTFLDKYIDIKEGKKTIANLFEDDETSVKIQKIIVVLGYISVILLPIFDITDWQVFLIYLTIPMACDLNNSLKKYSENRDFIPEKKWYHFPFEYWEDIKQNRCPSFMFRMYQARNLMIYVSIILTIIFKFTAE